MASNRINAISKALNPTPTTSTTSTAVLNRRDPYLHLINNHISHLRTPVLLVDKTKTLDNCRRVAKAAEALGVAFRPHAKTHKCLEIGLMQVGRTLA